MLIPRRTLRARWVLWLRRCKATAAPGTTTSSADMRAVVPELCSRLLRWSMFGVLERTAFNAAMVSTAEDPALADGAVTNVCSDMTEAALDGAACGAIQGDPALGVGFGGVIGRLGEASWGVCAADDSVVASWATLGTLTGVVTVDGTMSA